MPRSDKEVIDWFSLCNVCVFFACTYFVGSCCCTCCTHVPIVYLYCQLSTCPSPECLISVWAVCMGPGDTARTSVWCTVYSVQYIHCTVYSGHHGTTLTWSQLEMSRRAVTSLCELQYVILWWYSLITLVGGHHCMLLKGHWTRCGRRK